MRKLDLDINLTDLKHKKKKSAYSETLLEVIQNCYPRLIVRSDTGKEYIIVLHDDPYQSKCSCPNWIFKGAKLAKEAGRVGREPCKHLRAICTTLPPTTTTIMSCYVGLRFRILDAY